jgi:hypothetical protein
MTQELPQNEQPSLSAAMSRIQAIMSEVNVMGANDSEFESFKRVMTELESGTITPSEAVAQAQGIRDSKMDYH